MIALCKLCFAFKFNLAKYDLTNSLITAQTDNAFVYIIIR